MGHRSHTSPTVWVHYILRRLHIPPHYFLVFLAMLVGWLTAWAAYIFQVSIYWLQEMVLRSLANHWAIVFVPVLGGLICGQIVRFSAKEARGQGIAEVMYAVLMRGGIIPMRVAISKIFATVATLGSMGAAGQEGPIVQIGSALGSGIGQWFRLSSSTLKILVGCGAAAGISATFQAPIGGVLFALEVILGTFSPNTFTPIIIASVIASVTFQSIGTTHSMLNLHVESPGISMEMIGFVSTGLFCGLVSVFMIRSLCASERWFQRIRISEWVKPALGGLVIGILMLMWPLIGGSGERMMAALATGEIFPAHWLLALLLIKLVAICATLGSGGSGGVFFPSLVIGAVSGLFCHSLFSIWFSLSSPSLYMLIGMAAVVSGTTHGPIAAIIVLCELSGHFSLILPLMAASISSVIVARALLEVSIYGIKLKERGIHLKDGHDLDILRTYKVGDLMESNIPRVNGDT
ncbi:MAG: chloride channel protein, partial [Candidatus Cloacimonetes bacterium]|nr:chloride channel protein [Candidatus Cloacimonadota bacterium]